MKKKYKKKDYRTCQGNKEIKSEKKIKDKYISLKVLLMKEKDKNKDNSKINLKTISRIIRSKIKLINSKEKLKKSKEEMNNKDKKQSNKEDNQNKKIKS